MAGRKKQPELTAEEKLQHALVPEAEQPYKVPDNWCWTYFGKVCKFENGYAFKSDSFSKDEGIPVVRISDIKDNEVQLDSCVFTKEKNIDEKFIIKNGDLLIAMSGATTGKNGIYKSDKIAYLNQRVGNIKIIDINVVQELYRNYFIMNKAEKILKSAYGGAQPNISSNKISAFLFPLPPLAEQQRIIERIETLFAKLDEAKEKLQNTLDTFEIRKAAILHKAFTGELTANWRKHHGLTMDSWEEKTLGEVANSQYGYTESATDEAIGPKFLRITDIQNGFVNWDEVPYCKISDKELDKYILSVDDIVIARTGATTGKSYLIKDKINSVFASYLIRLKLKTKNVLADFIYQYMQSQFYWTQITDFSKGIAQPGVNAQKLKEIKFNLPIVDEQTEIVRIIDNLLAKEQQAYSVAQNAITKIDLIKKSILVRAFRGQLATNNQADEPAVKLLERVL